MLHNCVWPHRRRDAHEHGDDSGGEAQTQGLMQQKRANERSNDWIDCDGVGDARRLVALNDEAAGRLCWSFRRCGRSLRDGHIWTRFRNEADALMAKNPTLTRPLARAHAMWGRLLHNITLIIDGQLVCLFVTKGRVTPHMPAHRRPAWCSLRVELGRRFRLLAVRFRRIKAADRRAREEMAANAMAKREGSNVSSGAFAQPAAQGRARARPIDHAALARSCPGLPSIRDVTYWWSKLG